MSDHHWTGPRFWLWSFVPLLRGSRFFQSNSNSGHLMTVQTNSKYANAYVTPTTLFLKSQPCSTCSSTESVKGDSTVRTLSLFPELGERREIRRAIWDGPTSFGSNSVPLVKTTWLNIEQLFGPTHS